MIGPTITAAGFLLFAVPGTGGSYWATFFPTIVVQGLGIALVIAPLTTTAMNSVSVRHSGLASGVNNAVSRTASLLAIPVPGIFVFAVFSAGLDARVEPPGSSATGAAARSREGRPRRSGGTGGSGRGDVCSGREGYRRGLFVAGFRIAMYLAAGLALVSAVAAGLLIEGKGQAVRSKEAERAGEETAPA